MGIAAMLFLRRLRRPLWDMRGGISIPPSGAARCFSHHQIKLLSHIMMLYPGTVRAKASCLQDTFTTTRIHNPSSQNIYADKHETLRDDLQLQKVVLHQMAYFLNHSYEFVSKELTIKLACL